MKSKLAILAVLALSGCGTQAIYSAGSNPVRIGEDVHARIYQRENGVETLSGNRVTLPAGGYYVPAVAPTTQP